MGALPSHASASALDSFNATVGGRLHVGVPFARSCYDLVAPGVGGSRNESQCAEVMQSYGQRSKDLHLKLSLSTVFNLLI